MSASRIQKLEALLERVHERRGAPRADLPAAKTPQVSPLEAAMQDLGVVATAPQRVTPQKPSSRPPKPTPAARPSVKPVAPPVHTAPQPQPKPQPVRPERPQPVAKPAQPIQLDAQPPVSKGPVAGVASKPESTPAATFGALLDRTLALRPR